MKARTKIKAGQAHPASLIGNHNEVLVRAKGLRIETKKVLARLNVEVTKVLAATRNRTVFLGKWF